MPIRHGVLGKTAVRLIARESRISTQVLSPAHAVAALAARVRKPRDADAITRLDVRDAVADILHHPDDLVPRHERKIRDRHLAVDDADVRAAHAARPHAHQHIARQNNRLFPSEHFQGVCGRATKNHRSHVGEKL